MNSLTLRQSGMSSVVSQLVHRQLMTVPKNGRTMYELSKQIIQGLPVCWGLTRLPACLPENTKCLYSGEYGGRRLAFLIVAGQVRDARPLFEAAALIRSMGFEALWLFDGSPMPSTRHMLCAALNWEAGTAKVRIVNIGQGDSSGQTDVSLTCLAQAAAESRLKVVGIRAGQKVSVTCHSDFVACRQCGSTMYQLTHASFRLAEGDSAPVMHLTSQKLGVSLSRQLNLQLVTPEARSSQRTPTTQVSCTECRGYPVDSTRAFYGIQNAQASLVLSSTAALELLRHYKTAWYIA